MRRFLLNLFRLYFRYFPIRKGKIPVLLLIDKTGLTKHYEIQTTFDRDIKINLNMDDWIQKQVFYFGRYEIEKNETLFWQNLIDDGQCVLDIGANIGYYSLMASARVGISGKVICFEPVSATFKKLSANVALNKPANVILENKGVADVPGQIELFVADENSTGSSSISMHVNFSGIKEKVQTIAIDSYVSENQIERVDVVKIDVEGCEPMVIKGMKSVMEHDNPIVLIEVLDERLNTIGSSKESLYELFMDSGYEAFEILGHNKVKLISAPKEGGLIVFKHKSKMFQNSISII